MIKNYLQQRTFRKVATVSAFAALIGCAASSAQAALLLEPYAGLELATATADAAGVGEVKSNATGPHLGGRVGFAMPLLFFALDYDYGSLSSSVEAPAGSGFRGGTLTRSNLFAEVGVKLPLLRAYAGYGLMNEWTFKDGAGGGDLKFKGNTFKFGAGFTGFPFIIVWLDYLMSDFNKAVIGGEEQDVGSGHAFNSGKAASLMLTVSLPIEL